MCTFDALIRRLKVRLEVLGTRLVLGELGIRDAYLTSSAAGAARVSEFEHIRLAAEMAVVELDAAADAHAAVMRSRHDNHLVESTGRVKRLRLAERRVVRHAWNGYNTEQRVLHRLRSKQAVTVFIRGRTSSTYSCVQTTDKKAAVQGTSAILR